MSVVRAIIGRPLYRTSERKARRHETQKASRRNPATFRREDVLAVCIGPWSVDFNNVKCSPSPEILITAYEPLSKQKAPKVLADAVAWMDQALTEFGIAGLSLRGLIEFLKAALNNSNAAVRTSATKTLVTVKLFAGSSKSYLPRTAAFGTSPYRFQASRTFWRISTRNCSRLSSQSLTK